MLGLWINKSMTTNVKRKLRDFKSAYTFNAQDYGAAMLFVIVKIVQPDTCSGCSAIKSKLENMKMSHSKHDNPKANLQIAEWINDIPITGETYSEIVRQKFTHYSTLSCPIFKDYMDNRRSEWEEKTDFTAEQVRAMYLNKYKNILTSRRWSTNYLKDAQILSLLGFPKR